MNQEDFQSIFTGDQDLGIEDQKLIKTLTIYKELMKNIKLVQPTLSITNKLDENISWVIHNNEQLKMTPFCHDYYLHWFRNLLRIVYIRFDGKVIVVMIDLVDGKLFLDDSAYNIKTIILPGGAIL